MAVKQRLQERITQDESGCWNFNTLGSNGYGYISVSNKVRLAHRVSYGAYVGEIPQGLQIDHLCRNRSCINPKHLEAVTPKENTRRGMAGNFVKLRNLARTECKNGHAFTERNTYIGTNKNGNRYRSCRTCHAQKERARRKSNAST